MVGSLARRLDEYWFCNASAGGVALLRVLVGIFSLNYLLSRYDMLLRLGQSEPWMYQPTGLTLWFEPPAVPVVMELLLLLTIILNVAFILGLGFRASGPAFAVALIWLLSYRNSWSMVYHTHNLLCWHVLILGCTRSADALSIDALMRWCSASRASDLPVSFLAGRQQHARYGWPVRLMMWATCSVYWLAGVAKVMGPHGWSWGDGSAMRAQVSVDAVRKVLLADGASEWALLLFNNLWLFAVLGIFTLLFELTAPLWMLSRRGSLLWALLGFAFSWGVWFLMGIQFSYQLTGLAFASFLVPLHYAQAIERSPSIAQDATLSPAS